jgi:hypothetical protein
MTLRPWVNDENGKKKTGNISAVQSMRLGIYIAGGIKN